MNKTIDETQVGTRTITNTDWPVYDQLVQTGTRKWTVIRELCNGVPRSSEDYTTLAAAREVFEHRLTGPKPRAGNASTTRIELRLTDHERQRWQALADRREVSLSQLIRDCVEQATSVATTTVEP